MKTKKVFGVCGDGSRKRRYSEGAKGEWYAKHRAIRFARRCNNA